MLTFEKIFYWVGASILLVTLWITVAVIALAWFPNNIVVELIFCIFMGWLIAKTVTRWIISRYDRWYRTEGVHDYE